MTPEESDQLFDRASRLERAGERDAALAIYDDLGKRLEGQENHQYAINCAAKLREYERMADDAEGKNVPPFFRSGNSLFLNDSVENLPKTCIKCGANENVGTTKVKVKKPTGMSITGPAFAKFVGKIKLPACDSCCRKLRTRRIVAISLLLLPILVGFGAFFFQLPIPPEWISFLIIGCLPILFIALFICLRYFDLVHAKLNRVYLEIRGAGNSFLERCPEHSVRL